MPTQARIMAPLSSPSRGRTVQVTAIEPVVLYVFPETGLTLPKFCVPGDVAEHDSAAAECT